MFLSRTRGWSWFFGFLIPGLLFLSGCGGSKTGSVTGKVYYGNQVLRGGRITFVSTQGGAASSDIEKDGSYTMLRMPVGEVKISVETEYLMQISQTPQNTPPAGQQVPGGGGSQMSAEEAKKRYTPIPPKYTDPNASGLTYTIKPGQQNHDIKIPEENELSTTW